MSASDAFVALFKDCWDEFEDPSVSEVYLVAAARFEKPGRLAPTLDQLRTRLEHAQDRRLSSL